MRKAIVIVALLLLAAGTVAFLRAPPSGDDGLPEAAAGAEASTVEPVPLDAAQAASPTPQVREVEMRAASPSSSSAASTANPDPLTVDELDRAARGGDARAACRMASEISRCQQARMLQRFQRDERAEVDALSRDEVDDAEIERRVDELIRKQQVLDEATADCDDYDRADRLTPMRYHVFAANSGHVPSMLATIHPMQMSAAALIRDPGLIDDFRTHASARFQRVMQSGDLRLLLAWRFATSGPEPSPLLDHLPAEWRNPALVAAVIEQLSEEQRRGVPGLDAFGRSPAIGEADRVAGAELYRRYFADSTPPPPRVVSGGDSIAMLRSMLSRDELACNDAPTR
jgi:hypothetical protein